MPCRGINPLMAERLLCLPYVDFGQLRTDEAPEVVRLDVREASVLSVCAHHASHAAAGHRLPNGYQLLLNLTEQA